MQRLENFQWHHILNIWRFLLWNNKIKIEILTIQASLWLYVYFLTKLAANYVLKGVRTNCMAASAQTPALEKVRSNIGELYLKSGR